jgi:hypothetical protein
MNTTKYIPVLNGEGLEEAINMCGGVTSGYDSEEAAGADMFYEGHLCETYKIIKITIEEV